MKFAIINENNQMENERYDSLEEAFAAANGEV